MARNTPRGFAATGSTRNRTHLPDDREGTGLLMAVLLAAGLTLTTTPVLAALLAVVPLTVSLAVAVRT